MLCEPKAVIKAEDGWFLWHLKFANSSNTKFPSESEGLSLSEKIAAKVVTSSADPSPIYSEFLRNLSGFNRVKLKQDGGNSARLAQDLLQACVMHVSKIDDLVRSQKDAVGGSVKRPTSNQDSVFLKIMLGVMLFIQSLLSNSA